MELNDIQNPSKVVVGHRLNGRTLDLDLSQESDGFRRFYAHLLAIYQRPPKQTLIFEHPEDGIHPGALSLLADEFKAAPQEGHGQIILTTHSPRLLDHFDVDQIRVVELVGLETRIGHLSRAKRITTREITRARRASHSRPSPNATGGSRRMRRLILFVEGDGESDAVPTLVKRLLNEKGDWNDLFLDDAAFRVGSIDKLVKADFRDRKRYLAAGLKRSNVAGVLLILDGDIREGGRAKRFARPPPPDHWRSKPNMLEREERFRSQLFSRYKNSKHG